jgi:hypothetical protein
MPASMPAVHEEVHQRTEQERQVDEGTQHVSLVLGEEEDTGNGQETKQDKPRARRQEASGRAILVLRVLMHGHGIVLSTPVRRQSLHAAWQAPINCQFVGVPDAFDVGMSVPAQPCSFAEDQSLPTRLWILPWSGIRTLLVGEVNAMSAGR